jgi:hypothetical protein
MKSRNDYDRFAEGLSAIIAGSFRRSLASMHYKSDHYMFILQHDQFMINIDKEKIGFFEKE